MLSKKKKYALIALTYLAREYKKGPVLISDLAKDEKLPKKFLELILLGLKNQGILQSKKGKGGGYALAYPPEQIFLGNILRAIDGPLAPVSCVSQTAYHRCEECQDEAACGIRLVMKEVRDAMANILDKTSLSDMLEKVEYASSKAALNYAI